MWSKISNVLRPKHVHEDPEQSSSQGEVMSKVFEQHPNLSVFHGPSDQNLPTPSPPGSPSRHGKRGMFKRLSRMPPKDDNDSLRAPSPMIGQPKKIKSPISTKTGSNSQLSLSRLPSEMRRPSQDIMRRASSDMLRSSDDPTGRSTPTFKPSPTLRRPSLDMLQMDRGPTSPQECLLSPYPSEDGNNWTPITPSFDGKFGSVRSILRDPKTPGTGQNVRFFSRDAYKVISPDQSMDTEFQPLASKPQEQVQNGQESFLDRLNRASPDGDSIPAAVTRATSNGKAPRPTVAEVFSPLSKVDTPSPAQDQANFPSSTDSIMPVPSDITDLFDVSQHLELPEIPPGLGFNIDEPSLDGAINLDMSVTDHGDHDEPVPSTAMTSTPHKGKGKAASDVGKENLPMPVDETIFHAREKSPRLPSILHDRSHSFSFGQTVFHSIINSNDSGISSPDTSGVFASSNLKPSLLHDLPIGTTSPAPGKSRSRALSDTVFQSMMRSPSGPPEADINDQSSSDVVVYTGTAPEPDPFRANATTYYTPQTMIPVTPPQGVPTHTRKTSKEESIIFSLQTQLALQTELCGQYETDLRARDELVDILGKKLNDLEKDDGKRKSALRSWKKKVQELEKTCRYLEEEVEGSRHDSMERSVMDEASGEALRMLHRQIAVLEREKGEWSRKEELLREEVETLENLVKQRSEDVMSLKETLWNRDESERELKEGIREAKEQMEMMGNISVGMIDEEELKKLVAEKEQKSEQERERHHAAELGWEKERVELVAKVQNMEADRAGLQNDLENTKLQLTTRNEEYELLKAELNAQWEHTEKTSEKIEALEKKAFELEEERDILKGDIGELEHKAANMETEWTESESRKAELEAEVQEVWNYKDELEKERDQLEDQLRHECDHSESLARALQEREERISELDQERQFALDNVSRLEDKLRQRDQDLEEYSQRTMQRESEVEQLREEMSNLRREYSHTVDEQARELQAVSSRENDARTQMEALARQQATTEVEMKVSKDKVNALKEEVERLRRQVHGLQQESADKEVKLVQSAKQRAQDREDLSGLNMALESKQQELELLKRKMGLRGTGGSTPAPSSRTAAQRRDSAIFSTPTVSRPSSAMSDSDGTMGKERKLLTETPASRVTALGRSGRVNETVVHPSTSKRIEGSMGPPPLKARPSMGTPTPTARIPSHSRSSSTKPSAQPAASIPHRRISSLEQTQLRTKPLRQVVNASPSPNLSEQDEKENVNLESKRRNMIPTPA